MTRILRLLAYVFHLIFALYLLGISAVALMSNNTLKMPFLPWSGQALFPWLIGGAIVGILSIILAVTGIFRYLFPVWAFAMLAMMVRGFYLQPYAFEDQAAFMQINYLTLGCLAAFLISLTLLMPLRRRA